MRWKSGVVAAMCIALLTSCAPVPEPSTEPVTAPSATPDPEPETQLPMPYPLERELLDGGAIQAVRQLLEVAENRPAIKIDVTANQVTLTVLDADLNPAAYRWQENLITQVASDVQYMEQSTFYPASFPIGDIRRLFEVAGLLGAGDNQMLQIMEYRDHAVHMTVTTRTETQTIFFKQDGTAFPRLGILSARDMRRGFATLTEGAPRVLAMGFQPGQGYWAEVQISEDVVERRTRMGGLPMFSSQRSEATELVPFDADDIDVGVIAQRQFEYGAGEACEVTIGNHHDLQQTTIEFLCDGERFLTDVDGNQVPITDR